MNLWPSRRCAFQWPKASGGVVIPPEETENSFCPVGTSVWSWWRQKMDGSCLSSIRKTLVSHLVIGSSRVIIFFFESIRYAQMEIRVKDKRENRKLWIITSCYKLVASSIHITSHKQSNKCVWKVLTQHMMVFSCQENRYFVQELIPLFSLGTLYIVVVFVFHTLSPAGKIQNNRLHLEFNNNICEEGGHRIFTLTRRLLKIVKWYHVSIKVSAVAVVVAPWKLIPPLFIIQDNYMTSMEYVIGQTVRCCGSKTSGAAWNAILRCVRCGKIVSTHWRKP
jgi:hypothetical protein